jgi:excisionase family DNA binding protein
VSRATDALLTTVEAFDVANDEVSTEIAVRPVTQGVELTTWIDALAMSLAAGMRVGASGMATTTDDDGDVMTVDDVAAMLKVGRAAVYESVSRGEIPHRRVGKQIRFSRQGIMRWLASWSSQGAKEET